MLCSPHLGLLNLGCAAAVGAALIPAGSVAASESDTLSCRVGTLSQAPLSLGIGREAYIEATVLASSGSDVLLAGKPTFLWSTGGGSAVLLGQNSIFGAVIPSGDRVARLIPPPIANRRLKPLAGAAIGPRNWGVIFSEMSAGTDTTMWWLQGDTTGSRLLHLWYAELRGEEWGKLARLPMPDDVVRLAHTRGSELVVRGDTMVWAVPEYTTQRGYAAVYARTGRAWNHERLPEPTLSAPPYLTLGHSPGHGFVLGLVDADPGYRFDENSLFLYLKRPNWQRAGMLFRGGRRGVHHPSIKPWRGDTLIVTWLLGREVRRPVLAMRGDISRTVPTVVTIDSLSGQIPSAAGELRGGPYWVTRHVPVEGGNGEIVLWRVRRLRSERIWSARDVYRGEVKLAVQSDTTATIVGPLLDISRETLTTFMTGLKVVCSAPGKPNGGDGPM